MKSGSIEDLYLVRRGQIARARQFRTVLKDLSLLGMSGSRTTALLLVRLRPKGVVLVKPLQGVVLLESLPVCENGARSVQLRAA